MLKSFSTIGLLTPLIPFLSAFIIGFYRPFMSLRAMGHASLERVSPLWNLSMFCGAGVVQGGGWTPWLVGGGVLSAVVLITCPRIAQWYVGTSTPQPAVKLFNWHSAFLRPQGGDFNWRVYVQKTSAIDGIDDVSLAVREYLQPMRVVADHNAMVVRNALRALDNAHFFVGHQRKIEHELIPRLIDKCGTSLTSQLELGNAFDQVQSLTTFPGSSLSADTIMQLGQIVDYSRLFGL